MPSTSPDTHRAIVRIEKTRDDQRLAFGWLYVCRRADGSQVVDHSGEVIDIEDLEPAVYAYVLDARVGGIMHAKVDGQPIQIGRLVESFVSTPEKRAALGIPDGLMPDGAWVGYRIDDDATWNAIKAGTLKMLSLGAKVRVVDLED